MNKYIELSDFEINKKVARNMLPAEYHFNEKNEQVELIKFIGDTNKYEVYSSFDPCNNPTDAMLIIIENNISITLSDDKDEGKWMAFDGDWYDEHSLSRTSVSYGDNYYRIAMICFLLMKDVENES